MQSAHLFIEEYLLSLMYILFGDFNILFLFLNIIFLDVDFDFLLEGEKSDFTPLFERNP